MSETTIHPKNKHVAMDPKPAKPPRGLKKAARKLAKAGKISPKAMKSVIADE